MKIDAARLALLSTAKSVNEPIRHYNQYSAKWDSAKWDSAKWDSDQSVSSFFRAISQKVGGLGYRTGNPPIHGPKP